MGFFTSLEPLRYDPHLRAQDQSFGVPWKYETIKSFFGEKRGIVFGPEHAAETLNAEKRCTLISDMPPERASRWAQVTGLSAEYLRENFPEAVVDAQQFLLSDDELFRQYQETSPKNEMRTSFHVGGIESRR